MLIMSFSMHIAGLLGAPRRTAEVGYMGAATANVWQPFMLLAAAGGLFLFVSILTFVAVALGTLLKNQPATYDAVFCRAAPGSRSAAAFATPLYRWGVLALVLAVLAYAGPLGELLRNPGYLAPGMRTW